MDETTLLLNMLSKFSPTGKTKELAGYLVEVSRGLGFTSRIDGNGNFLAKKGQGEPTVLLLGHMDTVEGEVPVKKKGTVIFGRGAVDAKGPLCAMILAASGARIKKGSVIVAGTCDEEGASLGAQALTLSLSPDYVIVGEPSGWNGITLGYKGCAKLIYTVSSQNRHIAGKGKTACDQALDFYNLLIQRCGSGGEKKEGEPNFDSLSASIVSISTSQEDGTIKCSMKIDLRTPPGYKEKELHGMLNGIKGEGEAVISGFVPNVAFPKNTPLARAFVKSIRGRGGKPVFKRKTGTSDMNVVAQQWDVPMVTYGPGDSKYDHTPMEQIDIRELRKGIEVLTAVIEQLAV